MAYSTFEQYEALYGTPTISQQDFPAYAERASDLIDAITQYRIVQGGGFSALPPWLQTLVEKATAAQVLYFSELGLETVLTGQTGQAFTVGKVSVSGGGLSSQTGATAANLMISPMARALLEQTPLMERGCAVYYPQYLLPFWGIQ